MHPLSDLEGRRTAAEEVRRAREPPIGKYDMWPRYRSVFVQLPSEYDASNDALSEREGMVGRKAVDQLQNGLSRSSR